MRWCDAPAAGAAVLWASVWLGSVSACAPKLVEQSGFSPLLINAPAPKPKVLPLITKIELKHKVQFAPNSAEILDGSALEEVIKVMKERPGIRLVRIEGHTDKSGNAKKNRVLSQKRAESVRDWLVKRGLKRERFEAKGYGPDKPIADNSTAEGRELNRRVEFNIVDQDTTSGVVR